MKRLIAIIGLLLLPLSGWAQDMPEIDWTEIINDSRATECSETQVAKLIMPVVGGSVPAGGGATISYSDAVGVYRFESGQLTTDSSGNGYTLTSNGDPAADSVNYIEGSASVELDGTGDYYSITNAAFDVTNDFSVAFWFRNMAVGDERIILSAGPDVGNGWLIALRTFDAGVSYTLYVMSSVSYSGLRSNTLFDPTEGEWYHVVVTYDASETTQEWTVWVSSTSAFGDEVNGTHYNASYEPDTSSDPFMVGYAPGNDTWLGNLDEVMFFSERVLTADEALALYNGVGP